MRYCPACQTTYTNETLRFCLQDGTELATLPNQDSEATLVMPKFPSQPAQVVPLTPTNPSYAPAPTPQTGSGLGWKITVAALALALVGVLGFVLVRELSRKDSGTVAKSANDTAPKLPTPTPKPAPSRTPTPEYTPTPAAALVPQLSAEARREAEEAITDTLNGWLDALAGHDLEGFLSHYADNLEVYYLHRNWSLAQVRENKAEAFEKYSEMSGEIGDLRIKVEPPGNRATATFTKSYYFKGGEKDFSGSTRAEMIFIKTKADRWLIAGERDGK